MYEEYVADQIAVSMDNLFDDENGFAWGVYVDASGRIQVSVRDLESDEIKYYTLEVSEGV